MSSACDLLYLASVPVSTPLVTVNAMPRNASLIATYDAIARKGRATRAVLVMACGVGLLQACNSSDAIAPVAPAIATVSASIRFPDSSVRIALLGDTVRVSPVITDRLGQVLSGGAEFSVETGVDVVSVVGGTVVARMRGEAVVKAIYDKAVARITVIVDPAAPMMTRVATDTIVPGIVFGIDGQNFALRADLVDVTVAGVKSTVLHATSTHIDAMLPVGVMPCQTTSMQTVVVTVAMAAAQKSVAVRTAQRIALARGESASMLDADQGRCTELVAPVGNAHAKYVVAVVNTSVSAAAMAGFELRGSGAGAMAGRIAVSNTSTTSSSLLNPSLLLAAQSSAATNGASMPRESTQEQLAESQHSAFLGAQRELTKGVGSPSPTWRALESMRAMRGVASSRAPSNVGDTVSVKALFNSCSTGRDIRARVVYVGSKALVLEDITSPRAGQLDAQYRQIGDEFDRVQYPLLQSRIGDPLAMDAQMGGDGRVTMLFTRFVNDSLPGIAGYVTSCNFYSKGTFAGSNEDEVFYARLATAAESPTDWRRSMRSTVMHESKHLAAYAERFAHNTPLEEPWLEESTARIAEELYSRTFSNGGTWKGNTGFATTVRCEVYQCDDRPLMMWKHFSVLQQYMRGVDTLTPIGAAGNGDFTYYASGWSLVRWAVDQYANDEGAWLKSLVRGGAGCGLPSTFSQAWMADLTIQLSGSVDAPGSDAVISHSRSTSGWRDRMSAIASSNCALTSDGGVRGLQRTSR